MSEDIRIDPEFAALCPPLSPEEYSGLEESLLSEGCRDALVVWRETGLLLDGHNRKRICDEYGISYRTVELSLPDRDAALRWIIDNQLHRRNLSPDAASLLRGFRYNLEKKANGVRGPEKLDQNDPASTAERLATEFGVSAPTIKRDAAFASAVETLKPHMPDITERVMAGDIPSRQAVVEAAKQFYETTNARQDVAVTIFSSESNEYYTPPQYIEAAREVMGGIDLDPASCEAAQRMIRAVQFYAEADDGFNKPWIGRVWLNPPYGKIGNDSSQGQWAHRMIAEHEAGRVTEGIVLVKAAVGYEWFELLWDRLPVCFARDRVSFIRVDGSADGQSKQGTAFFYVGPDPTRFAEVFRQFGRIILPEAQL